MRRTKLSPDFLSTKPDTSKSFQFFLNQTGFHRHEKDLTILQYLNILNLSDGQRMAICKEHCPFEPPLFCRSTCDICLKSSHHSLQALEGPRCHAVQDLVDLRDAFWKSEKTHQFKKASKIAEKKSFNRFTSVLPGSIPRKGFFNIPVWSSALTSWWSTTWKMAPEWEKPMRRWERWKLIWFLGETFAHQCPKFPKASLVQQPGALWKNISRISTIHRSPSAPHVSCKQSTKRMWKSVKEMSLMSWPNGFSSSFALQFG